MSARSPPRTQSTASAVPERSPVNSDQNARILQKYTSGTFSQHAREYKGQLVVSDYDTKLAELREATNEFGVPFNKFEISQDVPVFLRFIPSELLHSVNRIDGKVEPYYLFGSHKGGVCCVQSLLTDDVNSISQWRFLRRDPYSKVFYLSLATDSEL